MKPITFLGDSLKQLRAFPPDARQDAGYQLDAVQRGEQPVDFKVTGHIATRSGLGEDTLDRADGRQGPEPDMTHGLDDERP